MVEPPRARRRARCASPADRRPAGSPLITIAIPAYNRPVMLAEALASIAAQTLRMEIEVIVVDDGRSEGARAAVRAHEHRGYLYLANAVTLGAVANWNKCLDVARGKFVMVLHEDDALYPWYLETVLPLLRDDVAAVCTKTNRGAVQPPLPRPSAAQSLSYPPGYFLKSSMTPFPGVLMRRELALRLGGFDQKWGPVADYEFWYRLACAGRVEVIRAVGAFYRIGPGQWTERVWGSMLRLSHLLRLKIAREQFPGKPRAGRWVARFFTCRNARCYHRRFGEGPAVLRRCLNMGHMGFARVPAGWVWQALKFASGTRGRHFRVAPDAGRTPQIQQVGGGPDRVPA